MSAMPKKKVVIMGAAGRDFHNFNVAFRNNSAYQVVAFTAAQIPNIAGRKYPKELAGKGYPYGIPIYPEEYLPKIIKKYGVDEVVLAYSDLSHIDVMHKASIALAAGADFRLMGPTSTMLKSKKPVISVTAVRTGSGKSPAVRRIVEILKRFGKRTVVIRHPMPYGDLRKQAVQRFATLDDMKNQKCTIEEMEEYGPHIAAGTIVYAGVDYEKILKQAEREADVIVWDGGNNDFSFIKPDLSIVVVDCRRPGHESTYHPGEANVRMADLVILSKVDTAKPADIEAVARAISEMNPDAVVIRAALPITVDQPELLRGKRVLVIEDGPTLTHGGLATGAGALAAEANGAYMINPRQYAVGSIKNIFVKYPQLGPVLPAMGYSAEQMSELEQTINAVPADVVLFGTPIDLRHFMNINKPAVRVRYELREVGKPELESRILQVLKRH
ncbi:MAG: cyclic 2,3-diphosphoglycerate synthase [Candidatus Aenigmatarchaeota archaeon]